MVFCLCSPPGTLLFMFFSHSRAFVVSKILAAILCLYWLFRIGCRRIDVKELRFYSVIAVIAVCYFFMAIIHGEYSSGLIGGFRILVLMLFAVFCFTCIGRCELVDFYIRFALIASVFVMIGFVFSQFDYDGISQYLNPDERLAYNYIFSTSNALYQFGGISFPRMAFYFDEPGTFALIVCTAYILLEMNRGGVYQKLTLIVSGFLTMSMAFFLIFGVLQLSKVNVKNLKSTLVFWGLFLFLAIAIVYSPVGQVVDSLVFGRLESIFNGGAGNTRAAVTKNAIEYFFGSPLLGVGFNSAGKYEFFGANIFYFLAIGGVFFIPLYIPLFYLSVRYLRAKCVFYLAPILLLFFQRPDYLLPYGFFSFLVLMVFPSSFKAKSLI